MVKPSITRINWLDILTHWYFDLLIFWLTNILTYWYFDLFPNFTDSFADLFDWLTVGVTDCLTGTYWFIWYLWFFWYLLVTWSVLTDDLVYDALVRQILKDAFVSRGYHASQQTQTVPHLSSLVATPTFTMETVSMATKVLWKNWVPHELDIDI